MSPRESDVPIIVWTPEKGLIVNGLCGGGGIVGKHVWVTVVACTCMLS